jgi:hypothetical protein
MLLIELSTLKGEELFGKMKDSGDVKASTIRQFLDTIVVK